MLLSLQIKMVAAVAGIVLSFGSGWTIHSWHTEAKQAAVLEQQAKDQQYLQELATKVAVQTEVAIQGIRIENRTVYNQVQKEILRDTVYRDCVLPAAGVQLVNQARGGISTSTGTQSTGAMPNNPTIKP